jgi:hypothetical protein
MRGWIIPVLVACAMVATCDRGHAADLPPGIDCNLIRAYVAEHGKAKALAWAIEQGYSWAQIAAARRCLSR